MKWFGLSASRLFVLLVLLRCLSLWAPVIDVDEAWFSASASALENSPFQFFESAVDNKPPGTVWFYWLIQKIFQTGLDPRPARFVCILLLAVAALLIGKTVTLFNSPHKEKKQVGISSQGWLAVIVFILAAGIPTPELFATTTEALMLPFVSLAVFLISRFYLYQSRFVGIEVLILGTLCTILLFLKQTAIFFVIVFMLSMTWLLLKKRISIHRYFLFLTSFLISLSSLSWATGIDQAWYWSFVYPKEMLNQTRDVLFDRQKTLLTSSVIFFIALWPVLVPLKQRKLWMNFSNPLRVMSVLLLAAGGAAVFIGSGLFFHYYLLLIPGIALAFSAVIDFNRRRLYWMMAWFGFTCFLSSMPELGVFWGTDFSYYSKLGSYLEKNTTDDQKLFVWGGNALPHVFSNRKPSTNFSFVTSRFAAPPYATTETREKFRVEFLESKPELFIDLHERGDCRFNFPPEIYPWLKRELDQNYRLVEVPLLPWAKFYWRKDLKRELAASRGLASSKRSTKILSMNFSQKYEHFENLITQKKLTLMQSGLNHISDTLVLERALRLWEGLRVLVAEDPEILNEEYFQTTYFTLSSLISSHLEILNGNEDPQLNSAEFVQRAELWLERQFQWRGLPLPLALEGPMWWVSYALVKLQPVAFKKDTRAQHRF